MTRHPSAGRPSHRPPAPRQLEAPVSIADSSRDFLDMPTEYRHPVYAPLPPNISTAGRAINVRGSIATFAHCDSLTNAWVVPGDIVITDGDRINLWCYLPGGHWYPIVSREHVGPMLPDRELLHVIAPKWFNKKLIGRLLWACTAIINDCAIARRSRIDEGTMLVDELDPAAIVQRAADVRELDRLMATAYDLRRQLLANVQDLTDITIYSALYDWAKDTYEQDPERHTMNLLLGQVRSMSADREQMGRSPIETPGRMTYVAMYHNVSDRRAAYEAALVDVKRWGDNVPTLNTLLNMFAEPTPAGLLYRDELINGQPAAEPGIITRIEIPDSPRPRARRARSYLPEAIQDMDIAERMVQDETLRVLLRICALPGGIEPLWQHLKDNYSISRTSGLSPHVIIGMFRRHGISVTRLHDVDDPMPTPEGPVAPLKRNLRNIIVPTDNQEDPNGRE